MPPLEIAVVIAVVAAIVAPHLLPLYSAAPRTAATIWLSALALRALVAISATIFTFVYLPRTSVFEAVAEWCWHAIAPLLAAHLGFSGHTLANAAVILPALALAGSLLWVLYGIARAGMALHVSLKRRSIGAGPLGSTIVRNPGVLVAVSGIGRARIVVSQAALEALDREELEASLIHELGHIRRRHRPLLLLGSALTALGRLLPGTVAAERELVFNLERDADEYAVQGTRDPLALASAICKAAGADSSAPDPTLAALKGNSGVALRLEYLVTGPYRRRSPLLERSIRALAVAMASIALALAVTLPVWALPASADAQPARHAKPTCPS